MHAKTRPKTRAKARRRFSLWALAGGALALALVVVLSLLAGAEPYTTLGNTDPGPLVRIGTPLLRVIVDVVAALCTGSLVFATMIASPQRSGLLSAEGYAAVRGAGRFAALWCVSALALVLFNAADAAGQPLSAVLAPHDMFGLITALEEPKAWLLTAGAALAVAVGCRAALRWQPALVLTGLAVFALLPPLAAGHSSSEAGHDLATPAIMIHVPAAAAWIGALAAVMWYARRGDRSLIAARYYRLALVCWLTLVASGLVDALVLMPVGAVVDTGYGLLLAGKVVIALLIAAALGWLRRPASRRLAEGRWLRLAGGELIALFGTLALSVGMTHLPPPAFAGRQVTAQQTLLGYQLSGPPTPLRLVADWRLDVFFLPLAVLLAAVYLAGVRRLARRGERWPMGRTAGWLAGCLVLVLATSSGIGRYAAAMFSVHVASHMLIAMLAPVLLALGGPLTLVRLAATADVGDRMTTVRDSVLVRVLTHPLVALTLFLGAPFALYFTGLFDAAVRFHWAHLAINCVFLLIGYLFAWPVVGVDPPPRPLPNLARLGMLLAAMPGDIVLGASMIGAHRVIGNGPASANMYQALALPWVHGLLTDQRLAGIIALILGELTLLVAMVVLLLRWSGLDEVNDDSVNLLGRWKVAP